MPVVRIIAGCWRGRKVSFPDSAYLRPTPDRVRETVFNWLAPHLVGARVLDLFSGSGVLGFEALSRGAEQAVMMDSAPLVIKQLQQMREILSADHAQIIQTDALMWLQQSIITQAFNVVFLDPPFQSTLLLSCCEQLLQRPWLADNALVYTEMPHDMRVNLPSPLHLLRDKTAGNVKYQLWHKTYPPSP